MIARRTVDPTSEPVTLSEAKLHSRVTATDDDTLITDLIVAARESVEDYTGRSIMPQTWVLYGEKLEGDDIELPHPPLASITSITYLDANGTRQTLADTEYDIRTSTNQVELGWGKFWPIVREQHESVQITYVTGYSDVVPQPLKQAILLMIGHWYENRESVVIANANNSVIDLPFGVESLLAFYRVRTL